MSGDLADSEFAAYDGEWERPTVFYNKTVKYVAYAVVLVFLLWNVANVWVSPDRLARGAGSAWILITSMFPPDFGVSIVVSSVSIAGYEVLFPTALSVTDGALRLWSGMVETIAMSIVATVVGVIISVPIAVMAAENLVPRPVYVIGRGIVSVSRSLHELVIGIIVVVGFGFGALAGVIALVFATPGFLAKLLAEDLEDIDPTQMDAIRATGAGPLKVLLYGVLPQVMPRLIGLSIYRWDINIRAATILGVVGAGGIGNVLIRSFDRYDYQYSMAIILAIIAVVLVGEVASAVARRRVQ